MNTHGLNFDLHHGPYSVYLFEFPSGNKYIGSSKNPEHRWKQGYAYNKDMAAEIEGAGGIDAISKSIVRAGLNSREKAFFEHYYACYYNTYTEGYNIRPAGCGTALLQLDMNTLEPIKKWGSASQAERALGIPHNNILAASKGAGRYSAGGFCWCPASVLFLPEHLQKIIDKRTDGGNSPAVVQPTQHREQENSY